MANTIYDLGLLSGQPLIDGWSLWAVRMEKCPSCRRVAVLASVKGTGADAQRIADDEATVCDVCEGYEESGRTLPRN